VGGFQNLYKVIVLSHWVCGGPADPVALLQENMRLKHAGEHYIIQEDNCNVGGYAPPSACASDVAQAQNGG